MDVFRPRLYHIKNEKELREYFAENAGYSEQFGMYMCAGVFAEKIDGLWDKLVVEWKKDIVYEAKCRLE